MKNYIFKQINGGYFELTIINFDQIAHVIISPEGLSVDSIKDFITSKSALHRSLPVQCG